MSKGLELICIDNLIDACGYFHNGVPVNNGYGCDHPKQEERDAGQGKCYTFSCPIATEINPQREPEDRINFGKGDEWNSMSDHYWLLWDPSDAKPI